MELHTFTHVGIVKNTDNYAVMRSILLLEREIKEIYFQMKACVDYGMDAFLSHFKEQWNVIHDEIRTLLSALRFNVDRLVTK